MEKLLQLKCFYNDQLTSELYKMLLIYDTSVWPSLWKQKAAIRHSFDG